MYTDSYIDTYTYTNTNELIAAENLIFAYKKALNR
jgi:hypothetical protein